MIRLLPLALSVSSEDFGARIKRLRRSVVFGAVAVVLAVTAYCALIVAAIVYLGQALGQPAAALAVAAGTAAMAAAVLALLWFINRMERRRERKLRETGAMLAAATALSLAPSALRSRPLLALAAAGGVAFVATRVLANRTDVE